MIAKSHGSLVVLLGLYCCFICVFLFQAAAEAEYRVFVLKISRAPATVVGAGVGVAAEASAATTQPPTEPTLPPAPKLIQSTLDPNQYPGYYPLEKGESIVYVDTWKCPGRTGDFKPLCQRPSLTNSNPKPDPKLESMAEPMPEPTLAP